MFQSSVSRTGTALMLLGTWLLHACGGGGEATTPVAGALPDATLEYQRGVAQKAYDGVPRTPAGFYADPPLAGATGTVATSHLKNSDISSTSGGASFELCTDDMANAIAWSEQRATFQGSYADMVDMSSDSRAFEIVRVPRSDSTARLRQRVFKCSYLDRTSTDLANLSGPAGFVQARPLAAAMLRELSEYLWQFTSFNNADHLVLTTAASTGTAAGQIGHSIEMVQLSRAATSGECDRLDIRRWTHTVNTDTGALSRNLETTQTFRARRENGSVSLCP